MHARLGIAYRLIAISMMLLVTGCAVPSRQREDAESFTMVHASVPRDPVHASRFETLGQRPFSAGGTIVPYRFLRTPVGTSVKEYWLGYAIVARQWASWTMVAEDVVKCADNSPTDEVTFATGVAHGDQQATLVYGEVHTSDVVRIEVALADGYILQDDVTNRIFVLTDPESRTPQELRVLADDGQVINTFRIDSSRGCW